MMDEEIRQALTEVQEMKKMCGNINMKLTNIVTQRGQDIKKKLEAEYQRGLDDAWAAARKIALMDTETSENATGYFGLFRIMENLTPMQAIEKLKAYEEKQKADDEIKVGDEVKSIYNGILGTATNVNGFEVCVLWRDGSVGMWHVDELIKTNRHFDIASILKEMQS